VVCGLWFFLGSWLEGVRFRVDEGGIKLRVDKGGIRFRVCVVCFIRFLGLELILEYLY
jgi:hypothetical protein